MTDTLVAPTSYPTSPPSDVPPKLQRMWRCGFCAAGNHRSCPGAVRIRAGHLILCYCCRVDPRCLDCSMANLDEVDPVNWRCLDQHGCAARVKARLEDAPLWRMLQQCKASAANTRRIRREEAERIKAEVGPEVDEFDRPVVRPPRQPRPTKGECLCCGAETKGGQFLPGHDAKLKARLRKAAKAGDATAQEQLNARGWGPK